MVYLISCHYEREQIDTIFATMSKYGRLTYNVKFMVTERYIDTYKVLPPVCMKLTNEELCDDHPFNNIHVNEVGRYGENLFDYASRSIPSVFACADQTLIHYMLDNHLDSIVRFFDRLYDTKSEIHIGLFANIMRVVYILWAYRNEETLLLLNPKRLVEFIRRTGLWTNAFKNITHTVDRCAVHLPQCIVEHMTVDERDELQKWYTDNA